jgi:tetratricopeptide (TPR) repeat protein
MERERVTEIWVDGQMQNGSGYLLADRLVLTCWHVVKGVDLGGRVEVRPLGRPASAARLSASVRWFLPEVTYDVIKNKAWLDAALLEIDDPGWHPARPYASVRFGRVPAEDRVACRGSGFPDAEYRTDENVRDTLPVRGLVDPLHRAKSGMLTIRADKGTELEHSTDWKGGSGTALFCDSLLIGVLALARPHDPGVLIAVPVTALEDLPGFGDTLTEHRVPLRFEDASDPGRGAIVRRYLAAASKEARGQPYPGVRGTAPPLDAVYRPQQARQDPVPAGDRAAGDAIPSSAALMSTDDVLAELETCVVTGGPGGGKSSLLRTWTARLADRQHQALQPDVTPMWAPVLVQAAAVAERLREPDSLPLPDALAAAAAAAAQGHGFPDSTSVMAALLRADPLPDSRWLVLIDGLDEVTAGGVRERLLREVAAYVADHPHLCRFIIATRSATESELTALGGGIRVFELQPFRPGDLPDVAQGWFTALAEPDPDESARAFLAAVHRAGLGGLAGVPLITAMLCQLYASDTGRPLPGSRGAVYGEFVEHLRKHYSDEGPGDLHKQTEADMADYRSTTAPIAAHQLVNHLHGLVAHLAAERWRGSTARALDIVAAHPDASRPAGIDFEKWRSFLDSSLRRSGLLMVQGNDLVFVHRTFLEYLAAWHAARTSPEALASALREVTGRTARYKPGAADMAAPRRPARRYWVPPSPEAASYAGFLIDLAQATRPPIERCGILFSDPGLIRTREGADFLITLIGLGTRLPDRLRQHTADLLHALAPAYTPALSHSSRLRDGPGHLITIHTDHEARMRVIRGLIELGDPRGADHLYNGARFLRNEIFQEEEARELARLGDPRGAELLVGFAGDPGVFDGSRVTAARDLAELGDPRGTDFLFTLANDSSLDDKILGGYSRIRAAQDLAQLGDRRGIELLRSFVFGFGDRPHVPRVEAARRLAELGYPRTADIWYELAAYDVWSQHGTSRVEAARELAKLGDLRTVDAWHTIARTGGLHDTSRVEAARELARLGDPRAADTWHALAHDHGLDDADRSPESRGWHQTEAAQGLAEIGDPRAADTWHALAHDPGLASGWRVGAARGLADLGDPRAADTWHALAHDRRLHHDSRACAAQELAELGDPRGADALYARALSSGSNDADREAAARELADLEDPRGFELLLAFANDAGLGGDARIAAARNLAEFGDYRGTGLLLTLADEVGLDGDARIAAARELTELGDARGADRLQSFALNPAPQEDFRVEAARVLGGLGDARAADTWHALAHDPSLRDETRLGAARELANLPDPRAVGTWLALARDPGLHEGSRVEAVRRLAQAGDPCAADTWYDFAYDPGLEDFARAEAAQGLADLGDPRAADTWHALAHDPGLAICSRVFAARELAQLGDPRAADTRSVLVCDPGLAGDPQAYAARQLARLGGLDGDARAGLGDADAESAGHAPSPFVRPSMEADARDRLLALPDDAAGDVAWAALGLLAAADGPLSMGDVAGILNIPVAQVGQAIQPVADLIVRDGQLEIGGETVRRAITGHLGQTALQARGQELARWCSGLAASGQRGHDVPDYVVRHGAAALAAAGDSQALFRLADPRWMRLSAARTGSLAAFTSDMLLAAQAAAAQSPPDRLAELRATLAMVTSSDIAAGVPPAALGVLAMAGQAKRAMDLAAMVEPVVRSDGYYRIAIALLGAGDAEAADTAAVEAVAVATSYARESGIHYMLETLVRSLHQNGRPAWALRALVALQAETSSSRIDDYLAVGILTDAGDADGAWQVARRIPDPVHRGLAVGNFVAGALARAGRIQDAIAAAQTAGESSWGLMGDIAAIAAENGDAAAATAVMNSVPAEHREPVAAKVSEVWARVGRVDDALTIVQGIDDADRRGNTLRAVATVLAETGQADAAISLWAAAIPDDREDYVVAGLAKTAAVAGDVEGALRIAAAISDDHRRRTALTYVASAVASGGDLERSAAVVRMIGNQPDEDHAFAEVARDLAASGRFGDALVAIEMISTAHAGAEPQVAMAGSLAEAGDYLRSASLAQRAVTAAATLSGGNLHARALMAWARAVTLSARTGRAAATAQRAVGAAERAVAAAQRAVSAFGDAYSQDLLADALATLSGTLTISGREEEASAAAVRAIAAARPEEGKLWESDPRHGADHRAESVAAILAEAGPPEQAIQTAQSLAADYDRDRALTKVAARLARRGLADQAIEALRASPDFISFQVKDKLGEVARILARHGHGDGALQAAYALEDSGAHEFEIAEMICEAARILAENGWADAAVAAVRASRPQWNKPAAFTDIACRIALSGDIGRAAEIAQATVGCPAVADVAAVLSEAAQPGQALLLAEDAVRSALTAPPVSPVPADALAALERLAQSSGAGKVSGHAGKDPDAAPDPGEGAAAAQHAAEEAAAIADPAERVAAEAGAALALASTGAPSLRAEAATTARRVVEEAHGIADQGERALALGNAARAFALAGESGLAAEAARQCLAAAALSPFLGAGDSGAMAALDALIDIRHVAEALAGAGSLKNDAAKAAAFCAIARRLADEGQTVDLLRLGNGADVLDQIAGGRERISAVTGIGCILVQAGRTSLADELVDQAASQAEQLTGTYDKAVAQADQAELLAALGRRTDATALAALALAAAREPVGGWRGPVITKAVNALISCEQVGDALEAARTATADSKAGCIASVAAALFDAGEHDRAVALVSEAFAAVRAGGGRSAFYDLACTRLPQHSGLLRAWLGSDAAAVQASRELAAIEQWWAPVAAAPVGRAAAELAEDGDRLCGQRRYADAEAAYRAAVLADPALARAHRGLGHVLWCRSRPAEAADSCREAIRLDPASPAAHVQLAGALTDLEQYAGAEAACREALRLDPASPAAFAALGQALRFLDRNADAEAACRRAVRADPGSAEVRQALGAVLRGAGRPEEAEAEFREAIRLNPDFAGARANLGNLLYATERLAEAETECREAIRLNPAYAHARYFLGNVLADTNRPAAAEAEFREAIRLSPDHAPARRGLAHVLYGADRLAEAEDEFREAIRLDPAHSHARYFLGSVLYDADQDAEAEDEFREAIRLDPGFAVARFSLANLLRYTRRLAEAEAGYREAISLDPGFAVAHANLGNLLYSTEHLAEAEAQYREAIRLAPAYANAHYALGSLLNHTERLAEAEDEFREAIRLDPGFAVAHANLGSLLYGTERLAEAEAEYREAIRLDPATAFTHRDLGDVLYETGRPAEAEAEYRQAIGLEPADAAAHHGLGNVLTGPERLAEAEAEYREAIRLGPANAAAHHGLGDVLYEAGRPAEAEAEYREAIRLNPRFAEAYRNLARLLRARGKVREAEKAEDMAIRSGDTPR